MTGAGKPPHENFEFLKPVLAQKILLSSALESRLS
jgi:hypothetical protein